MADKVGHGCRFYVVKDGDAEGTYTRIGRINGEIVKGWTRATVEWEEQQSDVGYAHASPVKRMPQLSGTVVFDPVDAGDATQDYATGLGKRFMDNDLTGFKIQGRGVSDNTDEVLFSAYVVNWMDHHPIGAGLRTADFTLQPTGTFSINGTLYGNSDN